MPFQISPATNKASFSLQDALALQDGDMHSADDLTEVEAVVAETRKDQRARQEKAEPARAAVTVDLVDIDDDTESESESSSNDDNIVKMSPLTDEGTKSLEKRIHRGGTNSSSFNASGSLPKTKSKRRVVVLTGILISVLNWDEEAQKTVHKTVIKGTWQFSDEAREDADSRHTFELVSTEENKNLSSEEPRSGIYSGHFGLVYEHTTTKGKLSSRVSKIVENSVKLEFRKLSNFYRVQGFGTNALGGDFSLNGKAKPSDSYESRYTIEMRKTYLSEYPTPSSRNRTSVASSSPNASMQSQKESHIAKPAASNPIEEFDDPTKAKSPGRFQKDSDSEETKTHNKYPKRKARRKREWQEIPRANNFTTDLTTPQKLPNQVALSQTPTPTTTNGVDQVNGKGMWHAWTRSFDTPLLALLDLFDNAVDASWSLLPETNLKPKIRVDLDRIGRNGVVMRNASSSIPPLHQVLQVYKSSKAGEEDNSIGENGIGVKHACASLSGLSLVFSKTKDPSNGICTLSMGILMQELQRDDGIVLPSMAFPLSDASRNGSLDEVQEKLEEHCMNNPDTWGKAIKEYGDDHFGEGIDRCLEHMDILRRNRDWRDSDNVFAVVLANLKHAAFDNDEENGQEEVIEVNGDDNSGSAKSPRKPTGTPSVTYHTVQRGGETNVDEDEQRSLSLLKMLRENLPYLYLHLHDLDIWVESKAIESIFWERRLAELTKFELQLSQTELWSMSNKSRKSAVSDVNSVFDIRNPAETVRFFCGFDPYRCSSKKASAFSDSDEDAMMFVAPGASAIGGGMSLQQNNSAVKIYVYSRQSGRLIKVQNDPRNEMGLTAGSTDFCQGLTVIVDDYNGTLPLNPTKQDTAYGHSKHGQIHAANLKEWTAAIAHFYWSYHFIRFGSSKVAVTSAVSKTRPSLANAYQIYRITQNKYGKNAIITPLCKGRFITFPRIEFDLKSGTRPKIRVNKHTRENAVPVVDEASVISRLDENAASHAVRKKRSRQEINDQEDSPQISFLEVASTPTKRLNDGKRNGQEAENIDAIQNHDNDALAAENLWLKQQLIRYQKNNDDLQQKCLKSGNEVSRLQAEVRILGEDRARYEQEIGALRKEKEQLPNYHQHQFQERLQWKEKANRPRQQLGTTFRHPLPGPTNDGSSNSTDLDRLRREVIIYKSRADLYKKETESKKSQIEHLMKEKSRFEDRVQELEDAQLSLESTDGEELLQF